LRRPRPSPVRSHENRPPAADTEAVSPVNERHVGQRLGRAGLLLAPSFAPVLGVKNQSVSTHDPAVLTVGHSDAEQGVVRRQPQTSGNGRGLLPRKAEPEIGGEYSDERE